MTRTILSSSALAVPVLVAALACSGATTATASEQAPRRHTTAFTAQHTGIVATSRRGYVLTDDVVQHGQQVGADVLSCRTRGKVAHCLATLALDGGQMRLRITLAEDGDLHGRVTGGDGRYAGATGRVRGHAASEQAERVVVRWRV